MKRCSAICLIFMLVFLVGCSRGQNITLRQPTQEVSQISLINHSSGEFELIDVIRDNEIEAFLEDLMQLRVHRHLTAPFGDYGELIICIQYTNGHKELLGTYALEYMKDNEGFEFDGWHYISYEDLYLLFSEYVDESLLPRYRD